MHTSHAPSQSEKGHSTREGKKECKEQKLGVIFEDFALCVSLFALHSRRESTSTGAVSSHFGNQIVHVSLTISQRSESALRLARLARLPLRMCLFVFGLWVSSSHTAHTTHKRREQRSRVYNGQYVNLSLTLTLARQASPVIVGLRSCCRTTSSTLPNLPPIHPPSLTFLSFSLALSDLALPPSSPTPPNSRPHLRSPSRGKLGSVNNKGRHAPASIAISHIPAF